MFTSHRRQHMKSSLMRCNNSNLLILLIPESFNTNISHQLFDYKITFKNLQHEHTNSKSDFVLKN